MGMVTHPAEKMAKSACTHSARLVDRRPTASPGRRPRAASPAASSRTALQVSVFHVPCCLNFCAGDPALFSTRFQNMQASDCSDMASPSRLCAGLAPELFAKDLAHRALG